MNGGGGGGMTPSQPPTRSYATAYIPLSGLKSSPVSRLQQIIYVLYILLSSRKSFQRMQDIIKCFCCYNKHMQNLLGSTVSSSTVTLEAVDEILAHAFIITRIC